MPEEFRELSKKATEIFRKIFLHIKIYIFDSDLFLYTRNSENLYFKPVLSTILSMNFCSSVVNSQRLFCSKKADVKCSY